MRAFVLVSCLIVAAMARPEAGYVYNGLSSQQPKQLGLPQNVHNMQPLMHQQLPTEQSFAKFGNSAPHLTYGPPPDAPAAVEQPIVPEEPSAAQLNSLPTHDDSYHMAYQQSSLDHSAGGYAYTPQTQVHKHIYVHVPPKDFEDEDVIETQVRHQAAPKQKHYKIVFIKAPAAPSVRPPVVPPPPQNEEKTLIYVLHKKPEQQQDIIIPTAAPTKPSKPEVFFIKYKTKKEEAPVYGPPASNAAVANFEMEPRHVVEQPSAEYGAPLENVEMPMQELMAPLSSSPISVPEEQPAPQFNSELSAADVYAAPTMASAVEDVATPSNQYLSPAMTKDAVAAPEETHVPAANYGPPNNNRFFLKKK